LNASDVSLASHSTEEGKEEEVLLKYGQVQAQKLVLILTVLQPYNFDETPSSQGNLDLLRVEEM